MELYEPSQGLIWVFDQAADNGHGALFIQSTSYVDVASLQSIATNTLPLIKKTATVELHVRGSYDPLSPANLIKSAVWIESGEEVTVDPNLPVEEKKAAVKNHLSTYNVKYEITALVKHADGSNGGQAVNIIEQNNVIEVK